jgi:hypothetical protein
MTYAWISSRPISQLNVHTRCNLGACYRWEIEAGFLMEKLQGYSYEHAVAKNWNVMKGYHYLMRLVHLFNILVRFSKELAGVCSQNPRCEPRLALSATPSLAYGSIPKMLRRD